MRKKKQILLSTLLLALLIVGGSLMGWLDASRLGVSFFEEKVHTVEIYEEDDLIAMGGSFYNNVCVLKEDIVVDDVRALASRERPFIGVFDGQGHTITFSGRTAASLFGYIGEGGVVKNLHIQVAGSSFEDRIGAILALENAGQIINCKITLENATVSAKGSFGGMVAINRGIIRNAVVSVNMTKQLASAEESNTRPLVTGAVCAYNYGEIFSSVATVEYQKFPEADTRYVFESKQSNEGVGAIYGINNNSEGGISKCVALVEDTLYASDGKDRAISFAYDAAEVFCEDLLFLTLGFDEDVWMLREQAFDLVRGD